MGKQRKRNKNSVKVFGEHVKLILNGIARRTVSTPTSRADQRKANTPPVSVSEEK